MQLSYPPGRRDVAVMVVAIAMLAIVTIAFGERIGVNDGQGWDGQTYVMWARDFPAAMRAGVTEYQSKRVLPSAIVYGAIELLGVEHSTRNTIVTFQLLNALSLIASTLVLIRIALALGWSRATTWAAFVLTFAGFAFARQALYYPALTDTFAFLLGMIAVWAYLERRSVVMAVAAALAGWTWPALFPVALLALVLPRPAHMPELAFRAQNKLAITLALATAAAVTFWLVSYWIDPYVPMQRYVAMAHGDLFAVTVACTAATCAAAVYFLAREPRTWGLFAYLRGLAWRGAALRVAAAAAIVVAREAWVCTTGTAGSGITFDNFAGMTAAYAARGPLWNIVHHVVYFGPIAVLAIARWHRVSATLAAWGPAPLAAIALTLALSIDTESRVLVGLWPFVIAATIEATALDWTPRRVAAVLVLAIPWSKLWWKLGYVAPRNAFAWPDLAYTMHDGPRASDATFLAHGIAAAITAVALIAILRTPSGAVSSKASRPRPPHRRRR